MAVSKLTLEKYLVQLRRIPEHREAKAEQNIRYYYNKLLKELNGFLGEEYAKLAEDDKLTYAILQREGEYARFLQEVEARINDLTPKAAAEIRQAVNETYKVVYDGMVDAVKKSTDATSLAENLKGVKAATPEIIKQAVQNPVSGLTLKDTLEKNRKEIIYSIKQTIGVGLVNGDRMSTMARRISDEVDKDYRKSIRIARTEVHRVREAGNQDAATEIDGVLQNGQSGYRLVKIWRNMKDNRVRPQVVRKTKKGVKVTMRGNANHVKMEGQTVLADEPFDLGGGVKAMTPGQSGVAAHDCNCRCFVEYVLMNDEEYFKATGKHFPESPEKKLERKENDILNQKAELDKEYQDIAAQIEKLENEKFYGIQHYPVSVSDYNDLKDKLPRLRKWCNDIIDGKVRAYNMTEFSAKQLLVKLDDFEAKGKLYFSLQRKLIAVEDKISLAEKDLKAVRKQLMQLLGIDPKKMQGDIDDIVEQIKKLKSAVDKADFHGIYLRGQGISAESYFETPAIKQLVDSKYELYAKYKNSYPDEYGYYKKFFDDIEKARAKAVDPKEIARLEKLLKDKQDALAKTLKRYGLEDDRFSATRKNKAYWFKSKGKADEMFRDDVGALWQTLDDDSRFAAYNYTSGSGSFNRPLRGYDRTWSNFKGVGKVSLDNEGSGNDIKLLTKVISKSEVKHDVWLNRGIETDDGLAGFLQIDRKLLSTASEKELQDMLIGKVVTDEAFISASSVKGEGFSADYVLNIYAPKGTHMIYAEPFSAYGFGDGIDWDGESGQRDFGDEFETIIQRCTQFKVTKVEKLGGRIFIDVDIVGQKY